MGRKSGELSEGIHAGAGTAARNTGRIQKSRVVSFVVSGP